MQQQLKSTTVTPTAQSGLMAWLFAVICGEREKERESGNINECYWVRVRVWGV